MVVGMRLRVTSSKSSRRLNDDSEAKLTANISDDKPPAARSLAVQIPVMLAEPLTASPSSSSSHDAAAAAAVEAAVIEAKMSQTHTRKIARRRHQLRVWRAGIDRNRCNQLCCCAAAAAAAAGYWYYYTAAATSH